MQNNLRQVPLKTIIRDHYNQENGKFFYSFEITPNNNLNLDLNSFKIKPLFIDISWLSDQNLKYCHILKSPALQLRNQLLSRAETHVVNSITCYSLQDKHIEQLLGNREKFQNFVVLRGGNKKTIFFNLFNFST